MPHYRYGYSDYNKNYYFSINNDRYFSWHIRKRTWPHEIIYQRKLDNFYYELKDYYSTMYNYSKEIVYYQEKLGNYEQSIHDFIRNVDNLNLPELDTFFNNVKICEEKIEEYLDKIDEYYQAMKNRKNKIDNFRNIAYDHYGLTQPQEQEVYRIMQEARVAKEDGKSYYRQVDDLAADHIYKIKVDYIALQCKIQQIRYQF